jgi:hypothetical protein
VLDEAGLVSDSSTKLPTQSSVKAYVDALPTIITSDSDIVPYSEVDGVVILDVSNLLSSVAATYTDTALSITDDVDPTKTFQFDAGTIATGTTETLVVPTQEGNSGAIVTTTSSDDVGFKTFDSGLSVYSETILAVGFNGLNINNRSNPVEFFGNTTKAARIAFLHDSAGADPVGDSYAQTAIGASIIEIVARGHTGSPLTASGYSSGNQLRILGITTEAVQNASRGAYWGFYTTATAGSTNRQVFRIFETGAFGYPHAAGSGVGGTVTQATSKNTGVTLDKATGQITTFNDSLAANANATFVLTNSTIGANDTVVVGIQSGATSNTGYLITVTSTSAGSCRIMIRNVSGGALSDTLVLNYTVIKGAAA